MAPIPPMHGNHHMTSAGHHLAAQAGYDVFEAGGNAVDAGVAAGIALAVVHSDMVQFAGVAPIMIYLADTDEVVTISGLGPWPANASLARFVEDFAGTIPEGVLRTVVPAAPDAWLLALERYGTFSFSEVVAPAIRLAAHGFPMHHVMRDYIADNEAAYRRWTANAAIYLPNGAVPNIGDNFVQRDLASTLEYMASEERAAARSGRIAGLQAARAAFYVGDIAAQIVACQEAHGGWLTREDLAGFRSAIEPPVRTRFANTDVYTCGPWCQGPVLQQMLALLDPDELAAMTHNSASYLHAVVEAAKLAFADRERYYGDPNHVDVPLDVLLSATYNAERRTALRQNAAAPGLPLPGAVDGYEVPPISAWPRLPGATVPSSPGVSPAPSADTSYVCTVDAKGNAFSATPSDVSWEAPIVPGTGISPSTRGSQSWALPGHASSVAPLKRPRLTPNPALARRAGGFTMPFGTPGGDNQTQAMLQVLVNYLVFQMPIQDAIDAPRFMCHSFPNSFEPHTYQPGKVTAEGRVSDDVFNTLASWGHDIEKLEDYTYKTAGVCAIVRDERTGLMEGGADGRRMSRAIGR